MPKGKAAIRNDQMTIPARPAGPVMYGYARVSTDRQDTGSDAQRRALEAAGCTAIIEEQASGRKARPMLAQLVDQLTAKGATLRSLAEQFDTSTPIGRAMMGFAAVWAELESDIIRERTTNGIEAARARGQLIGRRTKLSRELEEEIAAAIAAGEEHKPLARKHRVSARTIRRIKARHAQPALPYDLLSA